MRRIACLLLLAGLCACVAPPGPKFETALANPAQAQGKLVLYNTGLSAFMRVESIVMIDDEAVCFIAPGEVMTKELAPGEHKLALDTPMTAGISVTTFTSEPGKTTYIHAGANGKRIAASFFFGIVGNLASSDKSSSSGGQFALELLPEELAKQELATMALCDCKRRGA